jgi:SAM-dependent methyltransferase
MSDEIAKYNRERWNELAEANVRYSRPALNLDAESARELLDPEGMMGQCRNRDVLCLAGGGGQQSAAFGLLGARVTVVDFSPVQLGRDRMAAEHYGLEMRLIESDMRDLSALSAAEFDVVYHPHSINFVPDPDRVFREVARVLRPGGLYYMTCTNPFTHSVWESDWDGNGYPLRDTYADGKVECGETWDVDDECGDTVAQIEGPCEFRHTLGTLMNELTTRGFVLLALWEDCEGDPDAEPGTWDHFQTVAAPWLRFWFRYNPRAFLAR